MSSSLLLLLVNSNGSQCVRLKFSLIKKLLAYCVVLLASFVTHSYQQSSISLNTAQWFVSNANGSLILPAQVPGGIYSDLRRNNVLKQDILYGKNDLAYRWVGNENWTYTAAFAIDQQMATSQSVKLVLHGIDTVSQVYLNGEEVGSTDNMFVRYKFDIKPHLRLAGLKNILVIKFESPIKYSSRRSRQSIRQNRGKIIPPYCPSPAQRGECHVNFIRKMQASFSWDWGPAFPSVGIYKNIEIEFGSFGIIRDILVETRRQAPLMYPPSRLASHAPTQVIISSNIRHNVQVPTLNKTVPYIRAPPYYLSSAGSEMQEQMERIDLIDHNQQQLMEENWLLKITLVVEMAQPSFGYNVRVEFNLNNVLHYESEHINVVANSDGYIRLGFNLRIDSSRMRVRPWWPNNAGGQNLYRLTARVMPIPNAPDNIRLRASDSATAALDSVGLLQARAKPLQTPASPPLSFLISTTQDTFQAQYVNEKEITFGFRTVELIQEPITRGQIDDGLTFNFRINGIDLFAMGSNWIPSSVLPENSNDLEYVRYLLQSAKDANMNMLRVWGGGIYESDEFYRMADEMGIMIWHDFMFACALYPVDEDFIASVRLEVEQQVQRLQHHPSIVLWAGNNENEMAIAGPWWPEVLVWSKNLRESYYKLYVETIKPIVQILDPTRPYIESSPSNGLQSVAQTYAISKSPNDNKFGDVHHYDYLSDSFEWSNYPSTRFASEYGFQSYPSFNALTSVSGPNDWKYPLSGNILHRQHRLTGETEMRLQIKLHFNELKSGGVDKLKAFLYVSQLTQAIAIKTETEFYRRNRFVDPESKLGKTMGALYWQLNDVWPAPTWSSIEFGGKWKMLHYFARRFFFPIQVVPYLIQPPSPSVPSALSSNSVSNALQQALQTGSSMINRLTSSSVSQQFADAQQQQQQAGPLLVVDLVRDDLFDLLDSFNVSVRFYRWTSFAPVWQDFVYVRNTRPQNVTRIYEQELARISRQPGVISISSGVFQVVIEQQPRLGLSQIENYLMPVAPNRVTAMRVAKISVELIQGPFELAAGATAASGAPSLSTFASERHAGQAAEHNDASNSASNNSPTNQWACAYRLTLVSDSIAMYVWLDLNFLNSETPINGGGGGGSGSGEPTAGASGDQSASAATLLRQAHLKPQQQQPVRLAPSRSAPDHIRLQLDSGQPFYLQAHQRESGELGETPAAHLGAHFTQDAAASPSRDEAASMQRRAARQLPPDRLTVELGGGGNSGGQAAGMEPQLPLAQTQSGRVAPLASLNLQQQQQQMQQARRRQQQQQTAFKPVDATGGNMLRYQFSDNAFNMFEPSKVVDLYLSRCLSKAKVEVALEVQSLADSL